MTTGHGVGK